MLRLCKYAIYSLYIVAFATAGHAQERTAAGVLDTQMTWSTLKSLVDAASVKSDAAHSRIDQILTCNKKNMIYSPDSSGTDTQGCIANKDIIQIVACGKQGKFYDGNACAEAENSGMRWYQSRAFSSGMALANAAKYKWNDPNYTALFAKYPSVPACSGNIVPAGRTCKKNDVCYLQSSTTRKISSYDTETTYHIQIYECQ